MAKRQKMQFWDIKYLLFSGIGGYPPPPLNGKSSCPKTLSGNGGYSQPPLNGKNPLSSFWKVPYQEGGLLGMLSLKKLNCCLFCSALLYACFSYICLEVHKWGLFLNDGDNTKGRRGQVRETITNYGIHWLTLLCATFFMIQPQWKNSRGRFTKIAWESCWWYWSNL